ncbi:MAG: hypothetical protein DMF23_11795 [Verrucomicrobia bacterium]|nr:MAG: hypothetical protein DMF23_11795 [Verrucomicrobiota bacterium]
MRSIRLGLGVATIGILTADHADCADFLQITTPQDYETTRPARGHHYKFRLRREGGAFGVRREAQRHTAFSRENVSAGKAPSSLRFAGAVQNAAC